MASQSASLPSWMSPVRTRSPAPKNNSKIWCWLSSVGVAPRDKMRGRWILIIDLLAKARNGISEHLICNQMVGGSSPLASSKKIKKSILHGLTFLFCDQLSRRTVEQLTKTNKSPASYGPPQCGFLKQNRRDFVLFLFVLFFFFPCF